MALGLRSLVSDFGLWSLDFARCVRFAAGSHSPQASASFSPGFSLGCGALRSETVLTVLWPRTDEDVG
jgi:hypothetical protein